MLFRLLVCVAVFPSVAVAQTAPLIPELSGLLPPSSGVQEIHITSSYKLTADGQFGELSVKADLEPGWHVYSVTQKSGGPMRTRIVIDSKGIELLGPFQPDRQPTIKKTEFFKVPVEEHDQQVVWTAPFRVQGSSGNNLVIQGDVKGQVCNEQGGCIPLSTMDTKFTAQRSGVLAQPPTDTSNPRRTPPVSPSHQVQPPKQEGSANNALAFANFKVPSGKGFQAGAVHASIRGTASSSAKPGETIEVVITINPDPGWHVYAYAPKPDRKSISKATLIAIMQPAGWQSAEAKTTGKIIVHETGLSIEPIQRYYESSVSWTVPVTVPRTAQAGKHEIRGMVGYQTCTESQCDRPTAVAFSATIEVGNQISQATVPLGFLKANYGSVAKFLGTGELPELLSNPSAPSAPSASSNSSTGSGFDLSKIVVSQGEESSIGYILILAFVGGFILNFMPCVLPVIGLKVMAFVQQAGENRGRVFMLNIWYSLGMISIFMLLATLASAASLGLSERGLGWGEQFNYDGFTIPLLSVVFVMGLSFLGVWEIPIPGFVGGDTASQLATKEGAAGAFFKGVITTILATPCSGPGIATALTWSATKPPALVYLVFAAMGLGMAFPYLLIGAFPNLVRFIPKPGAWMDTFKQLMGFVLLGTVVYMFTLVTPAKVVPTIALIFALWAACWWIGRTPVGSGFLPQLRAWVLAGGFAAIIGWFAFGYESNNEHELPWQPYSLATLDENLRANRTVMIDFTADW
ncbi:MAG: hypothetical protein GY768_31795 [Planctomycetaceae bacterium]|nr:hypothetical protein [Planctomycetaceae bacterium]